MVQFSYFAQELGQLSFSACQYILRPHHMMQHVEFNTFKTNRTYLVFGIYTELKSRTVVLDSASRIVSSRLFQLHQNKHKLMTFFMLLTRLRTYPILVFQSTFLSDFLIPKRKERQSEKKSLEN